jgi:hypothetical protein
MSQCSSKSTRNRGIRVRRCILQFIAKCHQVVKYLLLPSHDVTTSNLEIALDARNSENKANREGANKRTRHLHVT